MASWLTSKRLDYMLGCLDAAVSKQKLEIFIPATAENGFACEVNDRVTVRDGVHPVAGRHGIALDNPVVVSEALARRIGPARQQNHAILALA